MSHVILVGLGAIGSATAPLLARIPDIDAVTLIDPDSYDESNLQTQAIDRTAIGQSKVRVVAGRMKAINPDLAITEYDTTVNSVAMGNFRDAIIVCCVDNRLARQQINRIAWQCGGSWINSAISAPSMVRINVYRAGDNQPCLECSWDEQSYALLEQTYPCHAGNSPNAATGAPAELGTLAAALLVAELRKLLAHAASLVAAQLFLDTSNYQQHLTRFSYNNNCRADHGSWDIERLPVDPQEHDLETLFNALQAGPNTTIGLDDHPFVTQVDCPDCGRMSSVGLHLLHRLSETTLTCECGRQMLAAGFFSFATIRRNELARSRLAMKLNAIGFCPGDVITVRETHDSRYYQLGEVQPHA